MIWLLGCVLAIVLLTGVIALVPKGNATTGLVNDQLRPCPDTPNCVCSEDAKPSAAIAALAFSGDPVAAWQRAKNAVITTGGDIHSEESDYLWASFTTRWLRFLDDVELHMDAANGVIHIRSASRVGRSDFGVNRARVERIRAVFAETPVVK